MKLLMLHLSDLHITGSDDPVLTRADAITTAVHNIDYAIDAAVLVLSGDIAHSGTEDQYFPAWEFIETLRTKLSQQLAGTERSPVPVYVVAAPGNHDCDFSDLHDARKRLTEGVIRQPAQFEDRSVVNACTEAQAAFFQFRDAAGATGLEPTGSEYHERLIYAYGFQFGSEHIRFLCLNTASLSRLHEEPGSLSYPVPAIPDRPTTDTLAVTVFHHPYNWMEPGCARTMRKRVERVSDVILTGHEHDATRRKQESRAGERNLYVEGGVLQDPGDRAASAFNVFVIDTDNRKQKFAQMAWNGERYAPTALSVEGDEGGGLGWEDYQVNRLRRRGLFTLTASMEHFLADPGVMLTHRERGILTLSDIFVYPDLREVVYQADGPTRVVRGDHVNELVSDVPRLLITGDTQAGKTCLAKMLYREMINRGYVPVFVEGSTKPPLGDRLFGHLETLFCEQYEPDALEAYRQLDRSRRVLIVDDYQKLPLSGANRRRFLQGLLSFASRIVLLAHDLALAVTDIHNPEGRAEGIAAFAHYRIQPFGHVRRNRLIEQWLLLSTEADIDGAEFAHRLTAIERTLDTLVGKNFIPAFPVYVLSVLQAAEALTPVDTRASTHAYFYELFIRNALTRGGTTIDYDVTAAYLAFLSFNMFMAGAQELTAARLEGIHREYESLYDINRSCSKVRDDLVKKDIIEKVGEMYRFKYKYVYYYFVASYMRDHISEELIVGRIRQMSRSLYVDEHANILLFLAHLSKDPVILAEMLQAADELYSEIQEAQLKEDVAFLQELDRVTAEVTYEERDRSQARSEVLQRWDDYEDSQESPDRENLSAPLDPLTRLNAALKTVQILGQVLKNFPGSLEGSVKLRIGNACYYLGMRTLASIFQLLKQNERAIVQDFITAIREQHPKFDDQELGRRATQRIVGLAVLVTFGMVKRVSSAIGLRDLSNTYDRMLAEHPTPAFRLIHASLSLDHSGDFPQDEVTSTMRELAHEPLALTVLRHLVVQHFTLFPVPYDTKQKACAALGISFVRMQQIDPSRKMIAAR